MDSLRQRIKNLAEERGIKSIAELERLCGFKPRTIQEWDDHCPSADKVMKVADFFDVSVDYLLGREERTEVERIAEQIARSDEHRAFFDLTMKCSPEELKTIEEMMRVWKKTSW